MVLLTATSAAYGFISGPPASRTGAPGEKTCTECHIGTLNSGAGKVEIEGVPDIYAPGTEYTLTVKVSHPDRRRWGFQITALDSMDKGVGTFALINRNLTRIANGTGNFSGRVYVEHTDAGTFAGIPNGAEWQVKWTAPANDVGRITFYASGNAANNNNDDTGDNIYTTSVGTGMATPTIIVPAFKKGKIVMQKNGSNIEAGARLEISRDGAETQSFALAQNPPGTQWIVKKKVKSTPGNQTPTDAWPAGTPVTLVVKNADGSVSAPITVTR